MIRAKPQLLIRSFFLSQRAAVPPDKVAVAVTGGDIYCLLCVANTLAWHHKQGLASLRHCN